MGGERAKQFLELAGTPIIILTIRAFEACGDIDEIIVVLPSSESANFLALAGHHGLKKLAKVVPGGITRCESVFHGLQSVRAATAEIIAVHDGVRPFVTPDEISRTVTSARQHGAAILVAPVTDSIKRVDEDAVVGSLDRSQLRRALTPQCFSYELLRRAFEQADVTDATLTDDSVLVERLGVRVITVEGSARNIKITTKEDLILAEALIRS
jgi:2-C-methyl-D-erythritol 4-phosphate cytidylyltransferase